MVLRINGYYYPNKFDSVLDYVSNKMEAKMTFASFYKDKKPSAASGKLHIDPSYMQPPYNLKQRPNAATRPLLVMFEEPNCKQCDELHLDVLQKPETREAIKAFDVVLLNQYSNGFIVPPDGKPIKIANKKIYLFILNICILLNFSFYFWFLTYQFLLFLILLLLFRALHNFDCNRNLSKSH